MENWVYDPEVWMTIESVSRIIELAAKVIGDIAKIIAFYLEQNNN